MIVVDASVLYEVLTNGPWAEGCRRILLEDPDHAAPQLVDAEVVGLLRRDLMRGSLDETSSRLALRGLTEWPGDRFALHPFLDRVWDLRANVRTWDGFYVALAEALDSTLVTLDSRLATATGPTCRIQVVQ